MSFAGQSSTYPDLISTSCWVCFKETTTCLATVTVDDFVYGAFLSHSEFRQLKACTVCPSHLSDTGFCKPIIDPNEPPAVTQADIDKVKAEYEAKQAAKKAKKSDEDGKDKLKPKVAPPSTPPVAEVKKPKKFTLNRDFFAMRLDAQRTKQAKAVRRLPRAL